jgi:predicted MFS family arabinose efflux permease
MLNFAGDLGKFIVPAVFAVSLTLYGWRWSLFSLGAVSLLFALLFWLTLRQSGHQAPMVQHTTATPVKGWGILHPTTFASLLSIGVLDASVRNALLTFVPFLLLERYSRSVASLMLTVIFAGGALGKLGCGLLADRLGIPG